jgi:VanZ family protein
MGRSARQRSERDPEGGFFLHVAPAILYVVAIFYAGSVPNPPELRMGFEASDKVMHLGAFLGMQLTMFRAVRWQQPAHTLARQLLVALAITSGVGALLEFWQATLPNRHADFFDWLADTVGAGLGALLLRLAYAGPTEKES